MRFLDRSPFPDDPSEVAFRHQRVRIRADQIILWVSLTPKWVDSPSPTAIPFPAILDTGHTHTFSIQERHLIEWAGLRPDVLAVMGAVRDRGQRLLLRAVNVWVHANEPGTRDRLADRRPLSLAAPRGVAVYPGDFPRLPILGLRAIAENQLVLTVDGRRRQATLRTARKWWPFSRAGPRS